jgi:hypothetical protein
MEMISFDLTFILRREIRLWYADAGVNKGQGNEIIEFTVGSGKIKLKLLSLMAVRWMQYYATVVPYLKEIHNIILLL